MTQPNYNPDDQTQAMLDGLTTDTQSGFVSPHRHFKGTVVGVKSRHQQYGSQNKSFVIITIQIGNPGFTMFRSTTMYDQPNCEFEYSLFDTTVAPRENSETGVLFKSMKACGVSSPGALNGKDIELMYTREHALNTKVSDGEYEDQMKSAFEFVQIDGKRNQYLHEPWEVGYTGHENAGNRGQATGVVDTVVPDELFVELADGNNQTEFESVAVKDRRVAGSEEMFNLIMNGAETLAAGLVASGKLTKDDDGVYHKV